MQTEPLFLEQGTVSDNEIEICLGNTVYATVPLTFKEYLSENTLDDPASNDDENELEK